MSSIEKQMMAAPQLIKPQGVWRLGLDNSAVAPNPPTPAPHQADMFRTARKSERIRAAMNMTFTCFGELPILGYSRWENRGETIRNGVRLSTAKAKDPLGFCYYPTEEAAILATLSRLSEYPPLPQEGGKISGFFWLVYPEVLETNTGVFCTDFTIVWV